MLLFRILVIVDTFSKNNVASIIKYESSLLQKREFVLLGSGGHCFNNKGQNDCAVGILQNI